MRITRIEGPDDPRVCDYRGVKDPEWLEQRGLFIAEGHQAVTLLLAHSVYRARSLLVSETALGRLEQLLRAGAEALPIFVATRAVLAAIAQFDIHQGCLAVGERPADPPLGELLARLGPRARRLLLLDQVTNPDNVGALFRNARAFGVDALVLGPGCAHPLYRKAIRTSLGSALLLPFTRVRDWPGALQELRAAGFELLALSPARDACALTPKLARELAPSRAALLLGHEGDGLDPALLAQADRRLRIPIDAEVDSLNVATAAAIALYALDGSGTLPRARHDRRVEESE